MQNRFTPQFQEFSSQNPAPKISLEYEIEVQALKGTAKVGLTYQPDASIISQIKFIEWLKSASTGEWKSWEELAENLLDGFYDTLLPKKITINLNAQEAQNITHKIEISKSQPCE